MIKYVTIIIALVVLIKVPKLHAQQKEFVYKNFTQADGLPSNEIYFAFEDSKHSLWFATDNGVVRYNGHRFEVFETPDRTVFQIREDHKGRIWFFTYRAQFAYFENGKMQPYEFNDKLKNRTTKLHIKDVYIDKDDNIHLSSAIDSNYIIDKKGNITALNHFKSTMGSHDFQVELLTGNTTFTKFLGQANYGLGYAINVTVLNKGEKKQYQLPPFDNAESQYGSVCPDGKNIYFFYDNVIAKLKPDGGVITKKMPATVLQLKYHEGILYTGLRYDGLCLLDENLIPIDQSSNYFKGKSISSILFDYEEGIWLTTLEKGVFHIKNRLLKHVTINGEDQPDISYSSSFNDSTLLYATINGLHKLTKDVNNLFIKQKNAKIINVTITPQKKLICAGSFNGFYVKVFPHAIEGLNGYMLLSNPVYHTLIHKNELICPTTRYVSKYQSAFISQGNYSKTYDSVPQNHIKLLLSSPAKLFKDQKEIIWAGGQDGLYKSVPPYDTLLIENNSPQLSKGIDYIAFLEQNILAIHAQPGKIVLFDKDIIGSIEEKDGLLSNKIRFMLAVKNQLWVATQLGISVIEFSSYRPLTYTIHNIDKKDGLPNLTINHLTEHNQDIVAATSDGLYFIEKKILAKKAPPGISFYISNINYYKGDISSVPSITLPYENNRVIIKYRAICFNSFESVQYRYHFTTGDTVWRSTTSNEIVLENLEPGNYNLEVKAIIPAQQRTSNVQVLNIVVDKPWWQNNWLRLLALLAVSLIIYLFIRSRIQKIKAEEKRKTELNAKLTELEQTALRSQMNPHFIFNCLTSIQQLIISGNKVDANEYLVKFSRLIRTTLEMSAQPFISIREEKEYLEEYLFLEQLRLAGKFEYTVTADESVNMDEIFIPNMMVQPIVENCVRHGIKALENKTGIINVTFSRYGKVITCIITDNGIGRNNAADFNQKNITKHKSYGMDIVRKRLETFSEFNLTGTGVEIRDRFDEEGLPAGTEVILHLPYKTHL